MRPAYPIVVAALVPLACLYGACSPSLHGNPTPGGAGGAGGIAESGPTSAGSSGGEAADAATFDASAYCPGDAEAWQQLTAEPSACQNGTECCVIMSPCLSQAQIVGALQQKEASAAWPYCDVACNDCIPPAIQVACVAGMCLGRVVMGEAPDSPLRNDHCGDDVKMIDFSGKTGLHFGCGG